MKTFMNLAGRTLAAATASDFPVRPVKFVVSRSPRGVTDALSRKLSKGWAASRPGARKKWTAFAKQTHIEPEY